MIKFQDSFHMNYRNFFQFLFANSYKFGLRTQLADDVNNSAVNNCTKKNFVHILNKYLFFLTANSMISIRQHFKTSIAFKINPEKIADII